VILIFTLRGPPVAGLLPVFDFNNCSVFKEQPMSTNSTQRLTIDNDHNSKNSRTDNDQHRPCLTDPRTEASRTTLEQLCLEPVYGELLIRA
jgi:hypothetical protein